MKAFFQSRKRGNPPPGLRLPAADRHIRAIRTTSPNLLKDPKPKRNLAGCLLLCLALLVAGVGLCGVSQAQTMARRGWSGAAATGEPWWHRAVFYRIDPTRFQASGSASTGDLPGLALRLDYLETLGVDALVLEPTESLSPGPGGPPVPSNGSDSGALESFIREAGRHNLRVLPSLSSALQHGDRNLLLQTAHEWLAEGAAGIAIPPPPSTQEATATASYASVVSVLSNLLHSTPGDRVLLTEPVPNPVRSAEPSDPATGRRSGAAPSRRSGQPGSGRLATIAVLPPDPVTVADLRPALVALATNPEDSAGYPLLRLSAPHPTGIPKTTVLPAIGKTTGASAADNAIAAAAVLLASRSAALFSFGAELGLDTAAADNASADNASAAPLMQWTPTNIQATPVQRPAPAPLPVPGQPTPFGAYQPFVRPPPRSVTGNVPAGPPVQLDRDLPLPPPDPDTLPGFTTGILPVLPIAGATLNVATQERDPRSTLNAFRALLALRRGNSALRDGAQVLLLPEALQSSGGQSPGDPGLRSQGVLVFLRRLPSGKPSAQTVVIAANLGDQPRALSLDAELASRGLRPAPLRALFSYGLQVLTGETTSALRLPAHGVFIGELVSRSR